MGSTSPEALTAALGADPVPGAGLVHCATVEVEGRRVAVVSLGRPERHNALDLAAWREIARLMGDLAEDRVLRAVVVRGCGGRAFSAGADIAEFPSRRIGAEVAAGYNETVARALASVGSVRVPVIAMVQGLAVGGGCELAAACDVRLGTVGSRFGIPATRLGVTLGLTETRALGRAVGPANLKYLLFSGALVDARQALAWGLLQQVVEEEGIVEVTAALVQSICLASEVSVRAAKQVTDLAVADLSAAEDHPLLRSLHEEAYDGPDLREGVAAFIERRPPVFPAERR